MIRGWSSCLIIVFGLGTLTACGSVGPIKPDPLPEFERSASATLKWSEDVGDGPGREAVRFTPFVSGQRVFAADASGSVVALSKDNGTRLWTVELKKQLTAGIGGDSEYLYTASANGEVFCMLQSDGSILWRAQVSSEVIATPVAGSDYVVVRSIDGKVYALDKGSGSRRWLYTYNVPALSLHGNGKPLVVPNGVIVGLDNGQLVALRGDNGRVIWESALTRDDGRSEIDRLTDLDAAPQVGGSYVYAVNYQGVVAQIEPARGQSLWTTKVSSSAGLAVADNLLVVTDEFDTVWGLRVADGTVAWKQELLSYRRLTAPAISADGVIVIGDYQGYLHLLSSEDGGIIGRLRAGSGQITNQPEIRDGIAYVQGRSGKVSAIKL
ncbi:outer membrane protein assembly factor BamB [Chromatiales bacterium (ex Bugula neritina AB1)]|nr:outer membrane protein assembly factor BamB [Chromatiales bacterium (ex Bugula neritina AB1)]